MVIRRAHTAMPPKPTKWRVLRPARSTRNSWKQREKKPITLAARTEESPLLSVPCTSLSGAFNASGDVSAGHLGRTVSSLVLATMHCFSPFFCSKRITIPVSSLLSPHKAFNAFFSHRPLPSPTLCLSLATCLQSHLPKAQADKLPLTIRPRSTYRDNSEDGVHHTSSNSGIHRLCDTSSFKNPRRIIEYLGRKAEVGHSHDSSVWEHVPPSLPNNLRAQQHISKKHSTV